MFNEKEKQILFYPNISFKGWFLHSPTINTLKIEDFNNFGYSGELEFYKTYNYKPLIQTSAKSIYNFDTNKILLVLNNFLVQSGYNSID